MASRDLRRLSPLVGAQALPRVLRAQRLNADIDVTLDEEDEARALRLWRPLARAYPDDLAVMHGYVLALARVFGHGAQPAVLPEFLDAATRLAALDARTWEAASFAGTALEAAGRAGGGEGRLREGLAAYEEAERRAGGDRHARAMCLHHQAAVHATLGRLAHARKLTARAVRLAPHTEIWRFDADWRQE